METDKDNIWITSQRLRWLYYILPIVAIIIPFIANEYLLWIVNAILVYTLGYTWFHDYYWQLGQLAFANTAFFGIGAYTSAILMVYLGFPYIISIFAAAVIGGLAGF